MAYNTGNPLGSTDPRDFSDNSENLDRAVNNAASATWTDRFGNSRTTLAGQIGYRGTGVDGAIETYAAGLVLESFSTIILYNNEFYRPSASATLPYTTTATTPDVDANLVAVGDAVLRQDLAGEPSSGNGAALVNGATIYVGSVAESFSGRLGTAGQVYQAIAWNPGGSAESDPRGGGKFVFKTDVAKSGHNGGTVISPTVPPASAGSVNDFISAVGETDPSGFGCFVRIVENEAVSITDFGATESLNDCSLVLRTALLAAARKYKVTVPGGTFTLRDRVVLPYAAIIEGAPGATFDTYKPSSYDYIFVGESFGTQGTGFVKVQNIRFFNQGTAYDHDLFTDSVQLPETELKFIYGFAYNITVNLDTYLLRLSNITSAYCNTSIRVSGTSVFGSNLWAIACKTNWECNAVYSYMANSTFEDAQVQFPSGGADIIAYKVGETANSVVCDSIAIEVGASDYDAQFMLVDGANYVSINNGATTLGSILRGIEVTDINARVELTNRFGLNDLRATTPAIGFASRINSNVFGSDNSVQTSPISTLLNDDQIFARLPDFNISPSGDFLTDRPGIFSSMYQVTAGSSLRLACAVASPLEGQMVSARIKAFPVRTTNQPATSADVQEKYEEFLVAFSLDANTGNGSQVYVAKTLNSSAEYATATAFFAGGSEATITAASTDVVYEVQAIGLEGGISISVV